MIQRHAREISVALAYALLLLILALVSPRFYQSGQLFDICVTSAPILVAAVGMTLVILARHIDISVGSQFSICTIAAGLLAKAGLPMPLVALTTLLIGAGFGTVNGALVAGLRLPSIVVTLATMVILRESLRWWREGESVHDLPASFQWFGAGQHAGQWLLIGIALTIFLVFAWGLRYLTVGRAVYATGSDEEAARLAGIRPRRTILGVFLLAGALTGLASLLNVVRFKEANANDGIGLELKIIAAVVVGGTAISGGRGKLMGTLLGVLLLVTIDPALVFLHTRPQWVQAIQGGMILVAVVFDPLARKGK